MTDILIYGIPLVVIVLGLTEVIKRIGLPSRWSPLVAMGFGFLILLIMPDFSFVEAIIKGIIVGLIASGIWSGTKATVLNK